MLIRVPVTCPCTCPMGTKFPFVSYWSIENVPEYLLPSELSLTSSRIRAGPIKFPLASQDIPKWLSLKVELPTNSHTPRQKLPVIGGRDEFVISVPSRCHCTNPASIGVLSGIPGLSFATKLKFQNPTIPDSSSFSQAAVSKL